MNPVWPTKSIKIFHGISMDINVWIGIKRFHGTKIEYILRLASLSYPDEYDFCWGFNPRLFWEPMFVYAKQCMHICMSLWLTGCLTDHVLWYTKVAPAKDTLKKKAHGYRQDAHHRYTLCTLTFLSAGCCQNRARRKCVWHCGNDFISLRMKRKWIPYGLWQLSKIHE